MFGENPSTQMAGLVSSFKYEESNYMVSEEMEEYVLASSEAAYEYPGEQALMWFMAAGGGLYDGNDSCWWDQRKPSFNIHTCSDNNNWETTAIHMSIYK